MGRLKKAAKPGQFMTNRMTLYKCRSCNRTDRKPFDAEGPATCNHCSSPMDPLEIRYRCVRCGHIEFIEIGYGQIMSQVRLPNICQAQERRPRRDQDSTGRVTRTSRPHPQYTVRVRLACRPCPSNFRSVRSPFTRH
jgi:DNA-directed RNA polymerase subunit RPC12/RpoP